MVQKVIHEKSIGNPTTEDVPLMLTVLQESTVRAHSSLGIPENDARAHVTTPRFIGKTKHWRGVIDGAIEATLKVARNESEEVIGFGESFITPCGTVILKALYVAPDYQGHGIRSALLEETLPPNHGGVCLLIPLGSAAIDFYTSHGFKPTGEHDYTCPADPEYGPQMNINSHPLIEMVQPANSAMAAA